MAEKIELFIVDEYDQHELEKMTKWALEEFMVQGVKDSNEMKKLAKKMLNITWIGAKPNA